MDYWNSQIYVDNLLICELMNNDSVPFDNPHYLILNVAMGGTLGGDIQEILFKTQWK